ncbi:unnamed protein product, partial [Polarella glacialis]
YWYQVLGSPVDEEEMATSAPVDVQDEHEVLALHCNFVQQNGRPCACRTDVGWLTCCAHLFCSNHAKEWFGSNMDCPLCKTGEAVNVMK